MLLQKKVKRLEPPYGECSLKGKAADYIYGQNYSYSTEVSIILIHPVYNVCVSVWLIQYTPVYWHTLWLVYCMS